MARMPEAHWLGEHSPQKPMSRYDVVCVHTIVGSAPAHAAHFSTHDNGRIDQSRDTKYRSAANLDGNHRVIAIENEDGARDVPLTDAQITACAKILAWAHKVHGVPLQLCPDSKPTSRGLAYHRQGIDGNFGGYRYPGRVSGGEKWSSVFGKTCPRDSRIAQIPEILRRAKLIAYPPRPKWVPKVGIRSELAKIQAQFQIIQGTKKGKLVRYNGVGRIQQELNERGANLAVDGICDAATVAAWRKYEASLPAAKRSGSAGTPDPKSLATMGLIFKGPESKPDAVATPVAKKRIKTGTWNLKNGRNSDVVNAEINSVAAKHKPEVFLFQECTSMYGEFDVPGYQVLQAKPKSEGHVSENGSNAILLRDDVDLKVHDFLEMTETWKGPKIGVTHDPRVLPYVTVNVDEQNWTLLDPHGPFGKESVAEFLAKTKAWLATRPWPAIADGDWNQKYLTVFLKVCKSIGAKLDGASPDMAAFKGCKKVSSQNLGKFTSDHAFKIRVYEV